MEENTFLLVEAKALPDVFLRVLRAKELLASGEAKSVCGATRMVDVSRSAFYKYKDSVFRPTTGQNVATIIATLRDETGALHALLAGVSSAGASVITIHQSVPEDGTANVVLTLRTDHMHISLRALCDNLRELKTVVDIKLKS